MNSNEKNEAVSDETLRKLWRNPTFTGSYTGIERFALFLKLEKNITVSEKRLYKVLGQDSIYLMHKRPKRNVLRRFYDVRYYCELLQIDIAQMFEYNNYKYWLAAVDVFSSKVFTEPMKSKSSTETATALKKILARYKATITTIESDRGKEFLGEVKKLVQAKHIVYKIKIGKNKGEIKVSLNCYSSIVAAACK